MQANFFRRSTGHKRRVNKAHKLPTTCNKETTRLKGQSCFKRKPREVHEVWYVSLFVKNYLWERINKKGTLPSVPKHKLSNNIYLENIPSVILVINQINTQILVL